MAASSSQGKVFVGGLSWETDEHSLRQYFGSYGAVSDCVIMRDRLTGHPRGFGFVTYDDPEVAERVAAEFHELDGRQVEAKIAVPRSECVPPIRASAWRATKKVFIGGLPATCRETDLRAHFARFGDIAECQVMYDHQTGNSRGFGFVTFTSEATVDLVVDINEHQIMSKHVEVKRAEPKQALEARRGREAAAAAASISANSLAAQSTQSLLSSQKLPSHHQKLQHQHLHHNNPHMLSLPNPMSSAPYSTSHSLATSPPHSFHNYGPWSSLFSNSSSNTATSSHSTWNSALSPPNGKAFDAIPSIPVGRSTALSLNSMPVPSPPSAAAARATSMPSQQSSIRPSMPAMGFFTPAESYSPDLANAVFNAFYSFSSSQSSTSQPSCPPIPNSRVERRFHPYVTPDRIKRSYR